MSFLEDESRFELDWDLGESRKVGSQDSVMVPSGRTKECSPEYLYWAERSPTSQRKSHSPLQTITVASLSQDSTEHMTKPFSRILIGSEPFLETLDLSVYHRKALKHRYISPGIIPSSSPTIASVRKLSDYTKPNHTAVHKLQI